MSSTLTEETLIGIFEHRQDAQRAIRQLHEAGFGSDRVGFLARDEKDRDADDAAVTGAATGAAIGATGGAAIGAGILAGVIPVLGPVLAIGSLGTILLNAAGGAAVAGLTGALAGWGISEDDAKFFESEVRSGKYLVSVEVSSGFNEANRILRENHASMRSRSE